MSAITSPAAATALHGSLRIATAVGNRRWVEFENEWPTRQPAHYSSHLPAAWQLPADFFTLAPTLARATSTSCKLTSTAR